MKYQIENLLQDEEIKCHEIKASTFGNNHILIHFLITQKENSLPVFRMGYERYQATLEDLENNKMTTEAANLRHFSLVNEYDTQTTLFTDNPTLNDRNKWSTEHATLSETLESTDPLSNNQTLRNVSEMADNSIYNNEEVIEHRTYVNEQDNSINAAIGEDSEVLDKIEKHENKNSHSIWTSDIHLSKFETCSNGVLYELFKRYQPYIGVTIQKDLDTESRLNIDMQAIFGASFDVTRIKNNLFTKEVEYSV